jgi:hypothetical protein
VAVAAWQLMDGMLGKMIWNYIEAVHGSAIFPTWREVSFFISFFISQWSSQFNRCPQPKDFAQTLPVSGQWDPLPAMPLSQEQIFSTHVSLIRWWPSKPEKTRIHPRKPGLRSTSCEKLQEKKRLITNCRGEMMRDTKYDVIQKLSLQYGPHDYVTSLANWRPEDCMQTGKWIQCRHRRRGFGEGISVLNWMQCHEANGAILMPTMRTSLLLLNHQRLWSPTNSSISHLHWLLGKRNSYWFHAALKRCLSQVASCTHLWEAIGAAALSFLIVFNDMGPIVYVFVKWVLPPLALQT